MRVWVCAIAAMAVCIAAPVYADTLTLKSGGTVEGTVVEKTNEFIRIESGGSEMLFTANEIISLNGEAFFSPVVWDINDANAASPQRNKESVAPAASAARAPLKAVFRPPSPVAASSRVLPGDKIALPPAVQAALKYLPKSNDAPAQNAPPWLNVLLSMSTAVMIGIAIFSVSVLLFSCFCLMRMSQKTRAGTPWFAWVPIAQLFLLCDLAGLGYGWVLIFFTGIIPIIGVFVGAIGYGYIWANVAQKLNRPAWMGWLMIIPVVGIIIMGILAFTDAKDSQATAEPAGPRGGGIAPGGQQNDPQPFKPYQS